MRRRTSTGAVAPYKHDYDGALNQKAAAHEIGHVLNLGETDDDCCWTEVYSGDPSEDLTRENMMDSTQPQPEVQRWSLMSRGTQVSHYLPPTKYTYLAISLEEMRTVDTDDEVFDP